MREAEEAIDALHLVHQLGDLSAKDPRKLPDEGDVADCEKEVLKNRGSYADWAICVSKLIPEVTRVPKARFRMPSDGILMTETSGHWSVCNERTGSSLSSGLTILRGACFDRTADTRTVRWRLARVDENALRKVALFAAVRPLLISSPRFAHSFAIPARIAQDDSLFGWGMSSGHHVADAVETHYELTGATPKSVDGKVYPEVPVDPVGTFLAERLRLLNEGLTPECAKPKDRAEIRELLVALHSGDVGEGFDTELAELMNQVSCPD